MKFGTQNKLNMLNMRLIGIDYLDRKLENFEIWSQTETCFNFYEIFIYNLDPRL